MKILLLNDGGYFGLEDVDFPVQVDAEPYSRNDVMMVTAEELVRVGADSQVFHSECVTKAWAFTPSEYRVTPSLMLLAS